MNRQCSKLAGKVVQPVAATFYISNSQRSRSFAEKVPKIYTKTGDKGNSCTTE